MGTYFHGNSEIQASDGLQTLILMNPGYAGFADTQQQQQPQHHGGGNFVFFNSNHSPNSVDLIHAPPQPPSSSTSQPQPQQQFVGIPLAAVPNSQEGNAHAHAPGSVQDLTAIHGFLARPQYNFYNHQGAVDVAEAREFARAQQGLSLSLSSQQQQQPGFGNFRQERVLATAVSPPGGDEVVRVSGGSSSSASGVSNGVNGVQSVLLSSKYLKVAQELLDEVVKVGKGVKSGTEPAKTKNVGESSARASEAAGEGQDGGETNREGPELSTAERQEIQMKKAKLVNMLDEVEQRYRQYHQQMQIVISWFEQAAGFGSAKTYTALALQTISKQFRCLKDAILGQIRAASKSLGEEEINLGGKMEGGSRLKFVDNQLRQQRALQQLGMIQHNAWRPQRGLPERSVSVLRAWLFEHFLHPYPKDSDKVMLAKQTGLTRNQVSNWFINARVRLWKPMVEEMYMEEIKEQEQNGSEGKTSKKGDANEDSTSKSIAPQENSPGSESQKSLVSKQDNNITNHNTGPPAISMSTVSTSPTGVSIRNQSCFNLIGTSDMENMSPKKLRTEIMHSPTSVQSINIDVKPGDTNEDQMSMKFGNERQSRDGFTLMGEPTNFMGGFGSYPIEELGRFSTEQFSTPYSSNGTVSLTLGLPHSENLSMSATHRAFLPTQSIQMGRGVDIGEASEFGGLSTPTSAHTTSVYENYNIQNRKRFATQLLPDFVT